jgi:hypothetical protein
MTSLLEEFPVLDCCRGWAGPMMLAEAGADVLKAEVVRTHAST